MKVFISWSGDASHGVAKVLRDWLPSVIQNLAPYVSSEDIDKGARWSTDIAGELEESAFGILCVTKDNVEAPWLNFEAGALGKSVDKSRVCPFLFRIKRSEVQGPILQYQSTICDKDDVLKLLKALNAACDSEALEDSRLETAFEVWWPKLQESLDAIEDAAETPAPQPAGTPPDVPGELSNLLEEILEISRTNQRLLRDPESLLPRDYLSYLIDRLPATQSHRVRDELGEMDIAPAAIDETIVRYRDVLRFMEKARGAFDKSPELEELYHLLRRMDDPIRYIAKRMGKRLPREVLEDFERL